MKRIGQNTLILIVENDPLDAAKIEIMLTELGYTQFKTVANVHAARLLIDRQAPTLVICDIFLEGVQTGIDLRNQLIDLKIPCILMTQHENDQLYEEAKKNSLVPYLIKPFHKLTLKSTIDLLTIQPAHPVNVSPSQTLFVRINKNKHERVHFSKILWIQTEGHYCYIHTAEKKFILKKPLSVLLSELDSQFIRIHHSYAINLSHLDQLTTTSVKIGSTLIPLSRTYKLALTRRIQETRQTESHLPPGSIHV